MKWKKQGEKERDQSTGICPGSRDAAAAGKCERIVGKYEDFCGYRAGGPEAVVYLQGRQHTVGGNVQRIAGKSTKGYSCYCFP